MYLWSTLLNWQWFVWDFDVCYQRSRIGQGIKVNQITLNSFCVRFCVFFGDALERTRVEYCNLCQFDRQLQSVLYVVWYRQNGRCQHYIYVVCFYNTDIIGNNIFSQDFTLPTHFEDSLLLPLSVLSTLFGGKVEPFIEHQLLIFWYELAGSVGQSTLSLSATLWSHFPISSCLDERCSIILSPTPCIAYKCTHESFVGHLHAM